MFRQLSKMKKTETKMHTEQIIRRYQEQIELLLSEKAALWAKIKELEKELEIVKKRHSSKIKNF